MNETDRLMAKCVACIARMLETHPERVVPEHLEYFQEFADEMRARMERYEREAARPLELSEAA